jgi:hypothetical protein
LPAERRPWLLALVGLILLTAVAVAVLEVGKRFPLGTLIIGTILALSAIAIALYVGELVVIGWIVDFLEWVTSPHIRARYAPLEFEQVGEMLIVKLSDHIVTAEHCQAVGRQLERFVDEHYCDFILDFSAVGRLSRSFRGVMMQLAAAAREEAQRRGKPFRPVAVPPGEIFRMFDDKAGAIAEMGTHAGHGWVVLCGVPPGIRAASDIT